MRLEGIGFEFRYAANPWECGFLAGNASQRSNNLPNAVFALRWLIFGILGDSVTWGFVGAYLREMTFGRKCDPRDAYPARKPLKTQSSDPRDAFSATNLPK